MSYPPIIYETAHLLGKHLPGFLGRWDEQGLEHVAGGGVDEIERGESDSAGMA